MIACMYDYQPEGRRILKNTELISLFCTGIKASYTKPLSLKEYKKLHNNCSGNHNFESFSTFLKNVWKSGGW